MTGRTGNLALGLVALLSVPLAATGATVVNATQHTETAAQVFAGAEKSMLDAKNFHTIGHFNDGGSLDVAQPDMSPAGGGGSVQLPGVIMEIVVAAHIVYVKADEQSWLKLTGSQPTAELVANRWIKAPASNLIFPVSPSSPVRRALLLSCSRARPNSPGCNAPASWGGHKAVILTDTGGPAVRGRRDDPLPPPHSRTRRRLLGVYNLL